MASTRLPSAPLSDVTGVIFCGGQSRRFGTDKALALYRGRRMVDWAADSLAGCAAHLAIGADYGLPAPWRRVAERRSGDGPLAALETALLLSPQPWVAVCGVDMPLLRPRFWQILASQRSGGASVQALREGQPQPLGALYHRRLLPHITALLDAGERRLQLACPPEYRQEVAGLGDYLRNVNTPHDLLELGWEG